MHSPVQVIKVLQLEDNPADSILAAEYLNPGIWTGLKFDLRQVETLEAAKHAYQQFLPDIVLSDLHLGGTNGVTTVNALMEFIGDTPLVVLTGTEDVDVGLEALQAGASDYVIKGEHLANTLPLSIRFVLERHELQSRQTNLEHQLLENQKLESLGVMAGGIAHDFNNILASIMGSAGLAKTELTGEAHVHQHLDSILESVMRASDLCKQMLDYSGAGQMRKQQISPSPFLLNVCSGYEKKATTESYSFEYSVPDHLPAIVGDQAQFLQLFKHLHENAVEAVTDSADGIVSIKAWTNPHSSSPCETTFLGGLTIEVSDTGSGISKEVLPKVFEPFYSTKFQGRGLGLPAAQGIVRGLKGKIQIDSEEGKGTTVTIRIPPSKGETVSPKDSPAPVHGTEPVIKTAGYVLLVDDDDHLRAICKRALENWKHSVIQATSGEEGIARFEENKGTISFVLLDVTMPGMLGDEVFVELRKQAPNLPIIFMSGFNPTDSVKEAIGQGRADFLAKPFRLSALKETIEQVTC